MPILRVPADFPTIAVASAHASPGDTILVASTYAGNETATISVENLTVSAPAAVHGLSLIMGDGVAKLTLGGDSDINVTGNALNNTIIGNAGNNVLNGLGGQDHYYGLAGNDVFGGGGGVDMDIADYSKDASHGATHGVVVNQSAKTVQGNVLPDTVIDGFGNHDSIVGIRNIIGTDFADKIYGGGHANVLKGLGGNDLIVGNDGADTLDGGSGNDTLIGGLGADKLIGGLGADTFVFNAIGESTPTAGSRDTILDFNHDQGDKLDLHLIDARTDVAGNQAFTFIGTAAFSHHSGELRYAVQNGNVYVYGDTNGDGTADFSVQLNHITALQAGDVIL